MLAQFSLLPLLAVAYQTFPRTRLVFSESKRIIRWRQRVKAKHFDASTCFLFKNHPGIYNLGIVEKQKSARWQMGAYIAKPVLLYPFSIENKQFRHITLGKRILGDFFIWQVVIIVVYVNVANHFFIKFAQK